MRGVDLLSFSGHILLVAYLASGILALVRVPPWLRTSLLAIVAIASIIPIGRASLAEWGRSVLGDLSLPMQALLLIGILRSLGLHHPLLSPWRRDVALGIFLIETALILSALGILRLDIYGLGYRPQILLAVVLAAMLLMWRVQPAYALALLAGVLAFAVGGLESPNLWDYLFDPLLLAPCLLRIFSRTAGPSRISHSESAVRLDQSAAVS